jgi:predicted MPP superfamily phosphohydrolase/orotate phosphoribosyltransferase
MSINILHISDLHLERFETFDKDVIQSRYQERNFKTKFFEAINSNISKVDYVIITGDLANKGTEDDYSIVKKFLGELISEINIDKENILICPGNHDINWNKSERAYIKHANIELESGKSRPNEEESFKYHTEKFEDFKTFYDGFYSNSDIEFNPEISVFREVKVVIDNAELLLCLINSSFRESHHPNNHTGYIEHSSLEEFLKKKNNSILKTAILHHVPIALNRSKMIDNWEDDIKYLCKLHNIRLLLFGHQHKGQANKLTEGKHEFLQFSVGAFAKLGEGSNTFNILSLSYIEDKSKIQIVNKPFLYIDDGDEPDWHILEKKVSDEKLDYESPNIEEPSPVDLIGGAQVAFEFPGRIQQFSNKLLEAISNNNIFSSGHYHWNTCTRTLGFIDTYSLLAKREHSQIAKGGILELFNTYSLESEFILGLGQEGNVLGGFLAMNKGLPFTSIPYHSRKDDYSEQEKDLNLNGYKKVTIVTDVIYSASSVMNIIKEKIKSFKNVETINLLSLFYISKEREYSPKVFSSQDNRLRFYTVSDKIKIDKCKYENDELESCSIFCNKLEKVHVFHS